ncbi:unnamed protein product [Urochloa humidicola]
MEGRFSVALLLAVLAAAASSVVMLLEHRRPPPPTSSNDAGEPPFMIVDLPGNVGDTAARLALMSDDLSLAAFANRTGHWHVFPGNEHLFPGSTTLPFGNSYRDLIGGLANLPNLPLGQPAMLQATGALSDYTTAIADDNGAMETLKRGLATMTVATSETQRLQPIWDALAEGSDSGEVRVTSEHLPYIEHWDTICYEILRAERNGVWDGPFTDLLREHANIKSKEEALAIVGAITNSTLSDLMVAHARRA